MRTSPSIHELCLVVSDADRESANQVAVEVFGSEADRVTFDRVMLSPTADEPATHAWARLRCTEQQRLALLAALGAGRVPSIKFWRLQDGALMSTNVGGSTANTEAQMLADVSLQRIVIEMGV